MKNLWVIKTKHDLIEKQKSLKIDRENYPFFNVCHCSKYIDNDCIGCHFREGEFCMAS